MTKGQHTVSVSAIENLEVSAYKIPTDQPESDGTLEWDSTTLVLVEVSAGEKKGIGYTYADQSAAVIIYTSLKNVVIGLDCFDIPSAWLAMVGNIRNQGHSGIAYMAVSAVDTALWDLKAKLLDLPLIKLIGMAREEMPVYGSGGFTSYSVDRLQKQLECWTEQGINRVKMKIGRESGKDVERVKAARNAIGENAELFVDANGAYDSKQALTKAFQFQEFGVTWLEEPVSSDDLPGLHFIREHAPVNMEITAGEYGYRLTYFKKMLQAGAVDVLQADATRCGGITGFLQAGTVCQAYHLPLSSHCAPSLHLHAGPALKVFRHAEYFYDHARIEHMLFEGSQSPVNGVMKPDLNRPGLGLEFKYKDAEQYKL